MWATSVYNFDVIQGQTISLQFNFTNDSNEPIDLSGWTATSQLVSTDGTLVASLTPSLTPENGVVKLSLSNEDTAKFTPQSLIWDLALTDPDGNVEKPLRGNVLVRLGATLSRETS